MTQTWNKAFFTASGVLVLTTLLLALPLMASADGFVQLVGLPGMTDADVNRQDMETYINAIFRIAIIGAALIAVVKLIMAGAQYILTGIVTSKEQAKSDIRSAVIGLLIILCAVLILRTINPSLVNLPALETAPRLDGIELLPPVERNPNSVEYWCRLYGEDNCLTVSCTYIDSPNSVLGWAGYIPKWIGVDYVSNRAACGLTCAIRAGNVVQESFGNSGVCVYPKDGSEYVENVTELEQENLDQYDITKGVAVNFTAVPFDSLRVAEDRNNHPKLMGMAGNDFIGYLTANWESDEGREILAEYGSDSNLALEVYEYEVLRETCGTENQLVDINYPLGKKGYYCVTSRL